MKEIIQYIDKSSFELKKIFNAQGIIFIFTSLYLDLNKNEIYLNPSIKPIAFSIDKLANLVNSS